MIEVIQSIAALIVTLSILVTFHEFGHYWVARLCGVHVIRFSVGFGRPIFSKRGPAPEIPAPPAHQTIASRTNEPLEGTEFAVAAIPLGGYVKMLDEREGFVADDIKHMAFNRKPVMQRIAIVAAGPIANFILAIAAYWLLFSVGVTGVVPRLGDIDPASPAGQAQLKSGHEIVSVDGRETQTWSDVNIRLFERLGESGVIDVEVRDPASTDFTTHHRIRVNNWLVGVDEPNPTADLGLALYYPDIPPRIGQVIEGGRAEAGGLLAGDEVVSIDGETIDNWQTFVETIQQHPEQPLEFEVLRQDELVWLDVTPGATNRDGAEVGYIGAAREAITLPEDMQRRVAYPIHIALLQAGSKTWDVTVFTLNSIKKMIMGAISPKNLSGPITIAQVANATAQSGLESFIGFIALLSISLGVLNLLPIPVLDGGHLLYYFVELIAGRPVPERIQVLGLQMGMFLIFSIMILAFYNDLTRL